MSDNKNTLTDPFILNDAYPDPGALFGFDHKPVNEIFRNADIVLDTNVLLLLLNTGSRSIAEVERIYAKLISENRLFIPAQVAREFTKNKPEKIKNLYNQFVQKKQNSIKISYCPLFEGLDEYKSIEEQERLLLSGIEEYSKRISKMLDVIKQWGSNDPVSLMYRRVGLNNRIINSTLDRKSLHEDKNKRYANKLPPGYKDSGKDDEGIGDFIIWSEILVLGGHNKKDLIFVTGEEKSDWWTKSANNELHVRYELVDEYRRFSDGSSFQIINFSKLLELFEAEHETIDQAKAAQIEELDSDQEDSTSDHNHSMPRSDFSTFSRAAEIAVKNWVKNKLSSSFQTIHSNDKYIDFIADNGNGSQIGFEVKPIRHVYYIDRRIKEIFQIGKRFLSEKSNVNTAFRAVFVAESLEKAIEATDYAKSIHTNDHQYGYIIGYLNEQDEFSEVFRSYDEIFDDIVFW